MLHTLDVVRMWVHCYAKTLEAVIGTKILDISALLPVVIESLKSHDPSGDRAPGQHFIMLPPEALPFLSGGMGPRSEYPDDFVARLHRGRVSLFLHRNKAAEVTGAAAIIYTVEAWRADPDVSEEMIKDVGNATHVLVDVLAFGGPEGQPPLTPVRFCHNLAGGNNAQLEATAEEIREDAKSVSEYWSEWEVCAD